MPRHQSHLDVVYNHTAEATRCPTPSLRGIDNAAATNVPEIRVTTWITPVVAIAPTCAIRVCSSSWKAAPLATEMHVDGSLDLASTLAQEL
jgi:hypothetical protein